MVDDPDTMIKRWSCLLVLCLLGAGCQNTKPMFRARAQIYVRPPVYYAPRVVQRNPPGAVWAPAPAAPMPYSGVLVRRAPVTSHPQPYRIQQQAHAEPATYATAGTIPAPSTENIASRAARSRDPFEALSENSQMSDALDRVANEYRRLAGAKVREGIGFREVPQAENYVRVTRRDLPVLTEPSLARETLTLGLAQQGEYFPVLEQRTFATLQNPLSTRPSDNGDWVKVQTASGDAGWIFMCPWYSKPFAELMRRPPPATVPAQTATADADPLAGAGIAGIILLGLLLYAVSKLAKGSPAGGPVYSADTSSADASGTYETAHTATTAGPGHGTRTESVNPAVLHTRSARRSVAETRSQTTWLGNTRKDDTGAPVKYHYDEHGKPLGETHHETTLFGNTKKDDTGAPTDYHYDEDGEALGETRHETTFFGNTKKDDTGSPIQYHYDEEGECTGESRHETTFFGNVKKDTAGEPIDFHHDKDGNCIGESHTKTTFWGNVVRDDTGKPVKEFRPKKD